MLSQPRLRNVPFEVVPSSRNRVMNRIGIVCESLRFSRADGTVLVTDRALGHLHPNPEQS